MYVHCWQNKGYKILRHLKQTERDNLNISNITEKEWLRYYKRLWTHGKINFLDINECDDPVAMDEHLS